MIKLSIDISELTQILDDCQFSAQSLPYQTFETYLLLGIGMHKNEENLKPGYAFQLERLLARLERLVLDRFGCSLVYEPLRNDLAAHLEWREQLTKDSPLVVGEQLIFAVLLAYDITGFAIVSGPIPQDAEARRKIADLIELVLETAVSSSDRLTTLDQMETVLQKVPGPLVRPDNVIPLIRTREWTSPEETDAAPKRRLTFGIPCLIEAPSFKDIKRLAQELHELSGRYAFVYFSDLWLTGRPSELKELGPVTIFIPDISSLSLIDQATIKAYLYTPRDKECPQIVTGSIIPYARLKDENLVDPALLQIVTVGYLRMTRTYEEYKREGIFDFFFSSLVAEGAPDHLS